MTCIRSAVALLRRCALNGRALALTTGGDVRWYRSRVVCCIAGYRVAWHGW